MQVQSIRKHKGMVIALLQWGEYIISAAFDSLILWTFTVSCYFTSKGDKSLSTQGEMLFQANVAEIACLALEGQFLWAGSTDGHIYIFQKLVCHSPPHHKNLFNSFFFQEDHHLQIVKSWKAHSNGICSLLNVHGEIWSSSHDHSIHVWTQQVIISLCFVLCNFTSFF